nr:VP3 [Rotavirus A]
MKVIAYEHDVATSFADTQIYLHNNDLDDYENAFQISNITAYTVIYQNYSLRVLDILNHSGIASIIARNDEELLALSKSNYTYDFKNNVVYIHDYSYYQLNQIRTNQYWLSQSDIKGFLPIGWTIIYTGDQGILTRGHYNFSFTCQNTATDDDLIMEYIYDRDQLDFTQFIINKIETRCITALPFDRLSNRVLRPVMYRKYDSCINVGPRNESMFTLLDYPEIKNYPANSLTVNDLVKFKQSKWTGMRLSQFDIGQYKNMCNFLSTIYLHYFKFSRFPRVYLAGSSPSYWIQDIKQYTSNLFFETWDIKPTPFSDLHHNEYFTVDTLNQLTDNSILYIDIRTDRNGLDWGKWRAKVEQETKQNLQLAITYLKGGRYRTCCCKMTAMDILLPSASYIIHFPTTEIRSEYYIIMQSDMNLQEMKFIPKGAAYAYLNTTLSDNVFLGPGFKFKKNSNTVVALYALSNSQNDPHVLKRWINDSFHSGVCTVRLNNTFNDVSTVQFKSDYDNLYLPSDFSNVNDLLITSYKGFTPLFGLSTSYDIKPTGNNHLFLVPRMGKYTSIDRFANHMSISRQSHSIRFSEAATTNSGYFFRNLSNGKYDLRSANAANVVSGHAYNALVWFRYNYTFDLCRWIKLQENNSAIIDASRYYRHAPIEILYAINSAIAFAKHSNDFTLIKYCNEMKNFCDKLYQLKYADNPNYYIGVEFNNMPSEYKCKEAHLTMALIDISEDQIGTLLSLRNKISRILSTLQPLTNYSYALNDKLIVADVTNVHSQYYELFNLLYDNGITCGQSRVWLPHITLCPDSPTVKIQEKQLTISRIYCKKIKGNELWTEM